MTTKEKSAVFLSPVHSLRLVKKAKRNIVHTDTGAVTQTPGEHVEFHNGRFETKDPELVKWLRAHELLNAPARDGGFVERGREPGRPLPETGDLLEQIAVAAAKGDAERLADLYVQERHTHGRVEVLRAAAAALGALEEKVPPPPETPLHELVRERPAGIVGAQPGEGAVQPEGKVEFASPEAAEKGKGRTDLTPGGGSGQDGAYKVADLEEG